MVHVLFGPEVREMLQEGDDRGMQSFCEDLHPATVAEALTEELGVEEAWSFLGHTSIRQQAVIFEYFPIDWQVKMVEGTGRQRMAKLIEQMSHDDRAELLRRLSPRVQESLLCLVDEADRRDIATLVKYPENSVGALMTTDYAWLPASLTGAEALDRLRMLAPKSETIYYIYILDEQRRLLGVLSLRDLIVSPRQAVLRDLMEKEVVSVLVSEDREKVAREMARYDLLAMPVVDDERRMVGIVTHDDVIDVVVAEATEDAHRMGAVGPLEENYLEASFTLVWRKRATWLAFLFFAELFTFTALAHFEDAIAEVVVLSLFVPLCISTGGNSGSQAATLITRAIALGQVSPGTWMRVLRHEFLMGLVLGLTLGAIGFVRGAITPADVRGDTKERDVAWQARVPKSEALPPVHNDATLELPAGTVQLVPTTLKKPLEVVAPQGESFHVDEQSDPDYRLFSFPKGCMVRYEAVSRWGLAIVISMAVASICLWGTLVGSMLPLVFRRFGVDPGIASSPFVATFVDVTGIIIYFSIATIWLL
jgi:magnesium transporter